jgi:hypothetical protein
MKKLIITLSILLISILSFGQLSSGSSKQLRYDTIPVSLLVSNNIVGTYVINGFAVLPVYPMPGITYTNDGRDNLPVEIKYLDLDKKPLSSSLIVWLYKSR